MGIQRRIMDCITVTSPLKIQSMTVAPEAEGVTRPAMGNDATKVVPSPLADFCVVIADKTDWSREYGADTLKSSAVTEIPLVLQNKSRIPEVFQFSLVKDAPCNRTKLLILVLAPLVALEQW